MTHSITVTIRVKDIGDNPEDSDDVSAGSYLDAALAYMCEVADDMRRIEGYTIKHPN